MVIDSKRPKTMVGRRPLSTLSCSLQMAVHGQKRSVLTNSVQPTVVGERGKSANKGCMSF
jgi:hypothetical protein